jgi:ubiquitin C-terminal hydrolase
LYLDCLFPKEIDIDPIAIEGESLGAICQTSASRGVAYALLYQLCKSDITNLSKLLTIMNHIEKSTNKNENDKNSNKIDENENNQGEEKKKRKKIEDRIRSVQWECDPNALIKEEGSFVGLVNQGGTCYMNSFLQQLYHIPAFADGLLSITTARGGLKSDVDEGACNLGSDDNAIYKNQTDNSNTVTSVVIENEDTLVSTIPSDQRLLFQLQVMFGYLRLSEKRFFDTLSFCEAFLDYDGQPISLVEQKDINEFAGMLFDKLECNPLCSALLSQTVRGAMVFKTRSTETPYRSDREEPFYMITAEVKDKATLEDSLELYVADELFNGDNKLEDPDAGRKVDALRGCSFRTLPPTLIIHLKRFDFDLESMDRRKVNDHLSFPMELNMFPYTEEGLRAKEAKKSPTGEDLSYEMDDDGVSLGGDREDFRVRYSEGQVGPAVGVPVVHSDEYYQYSLTGIVAHVGAIDRGHYYSFIKERSTNKWSEFNDRNVLPFGVEAIPTECFGGEETVATPNGPKKRMKQNNAYLLLYEKRSTGMVQRSDIRQSTTQENLQSCVQDGDIEQTDSDTILTPILSRNVSFSSDFDHRVSGVQDGYAHRDISGGTGVLGVKSFLSMGSTICRRVLKAVWSENMSFQRERSLFDRMHFTFLWQLQCGSVIEDLCQTISDNVGVITVSEAVSNDVTSDDRRSSAVSSLSSIVLTCLRFNIEILARARASSCVPLYFQQLEAIILRDTSRVCAKAVLTELCSSHNSHTLDKSNKESTDRNHDKSDMSGSIESRQNKKLSLQRERTHVLKFCHPWIISMFMQCPHEGTIKAFCGFVLTCIKALRSKLKKEYLSRIPTPHTPGSTGPTPSFSSIIVNNDSNSIVKYINNDDDFDSCVTRFVDKLFMIAEKVTPEDITTGDGYKYLTFLLLQIANLGVEEKFMLIQLGGVNKIVTSVISANPSVTQIPVDELYHSVDLISMLMRSTIIPSSGIDGKPSHPPFTPTGPTYTLSPFLLPQVLTLSPATHASKSPENPDKFVNPDRSKYQEKCVNSDKSENPDMTVNQDETCTCTPVIPTLSAIDLQSFLNGVYLEDALNISSSQTALAIQHVCWSRGPNETKKILMFLTNKIKDCTVIVTGVDLSYRPYFRTCSEVLLGDFIDVGVYESVLHALLSTADAIVSRQCPNDAEFLYAVMKLLHRIGTRSVEGHQCVQRLKSTRYTLTNNCT